MGFALHQGGFSGIKKQKLSLIFIVISAIFIAMQSLLFIDIANAATASVSNEAELVAALADSNNDTINLTASFDTSSQVTLDRSVTIEGNGHTIDAVFTKTDNSNNSAIGVQSDNVTINNLSVTSSGDAPWPLQLHGINVYESTGVVLNSVAATDFEGSGIVVNGSTVSVFNVTTGGNSWSGINVDLGSLVTDPAILTVDGVSIHSDLAPIYVDDTTESVTVNDINNQYLITEPVVQQNDRLYTLDPDRFVFTQGNNLKVNICHATSSVDNPFTSNKVDLDGLNGHGDHENDIIPPNPDLPDGLNWTSENIEIWQNDCDIPQVLGDQCEVGPGWAAFVTDNNQGTKNNGSEITGPRSETEHVLGAPDAVTGPDDGFHALGEGGWIIVEFKGYVMDVDGDDLSFHEVTNGRSTYPEEVVDVEVSQDGVDWYSIGSVTNKDGGDGVGYLDFEDTGLDWVKFVRITEATNFDLHSTGADGYDLDAVDATHIECDEPEPEYLTIVADKVVCVHEQFLPNWGGGGPAVTETTAQDWVDQSDGNCQLIEWQFQWAPNTSNPGDQVSEAGDPWTTFVGEVTLSEDDLDNTSKIWIREVFQEGWVPFTGANKTQDVSAELYCETDVLNYDNFDFIKNYEFGETYHCVGFNAPEVQPCEVGHTIFRIGEDEVDQLQPPQDEFSWNGVFGDFSKPTDDPFVIPFSPDERFPWNSNFNSGVATDFDVEFYYRGPDGTHVELTLAWGPGRSANEIKEVYINGDFVGDSSHLGTSVGGWYENMEIFDDTFSFTIDNGWNTLNLLHTTGNGTLWDFVELEVTDCGNGEIQGRKYHDVNANGNFDRVEKQADGNVNRLNGWQIWLYDSDWGLVDSMETGDDGTDAGNVGRGQYRFVDLDIGTYFVCEEDRDGWVQTEPNSGETLGDLYCHTVEIDGNGERVAGVQFGNYEPLGQIAGLTYNDLEGDSVQNGSDVPLESWDIWLLTHNSPFTIRDIFTTDNTGTYLFEDLPYGIYFVCQDMQDGWLQTQLNNAGADGVYPLSPSIGDVVDLNDAVVGQFCYEIELTADDPISLANDFGNFQQEVENTGEVLGETTGNVLGTTTGGQVLAETGQFVLIAMLAALSTVAISLFAATASRQD